MVKKNVSLMDFEGNPNIGIYMFVNNKFCLMGEDIKEEKKKEIEKTLSVPVYKVSVLSTSLIGLFLSGNDEYLISPPMYDYEKKVLESICQKHETKLIIIEDIQNTFGNNLCMGKDKVLINPQYSKEFASKLKKATGYEIIKIESSKFSSIGSTCRYINGKYYLSQEYSEDELKNIIENIGGIGTVNSGSYYVSSGIVGNSKGAIIGSMSSTVEIQNIVESLDYL